MMQLLGDRYRVERELGRGGMGRVFVAHDLKLDRDVALKVLPPGDHDARDVLRFEQEARAAGALDHPNVVAVHDIGTHDGAPYIISELLEGEELRAQLNEGALPVRQALDYAQQMGSGLSAAHEKGVVHRDLKPENLFAKRWITSERANTARASCRARSMVRLSGLLSILRSAPGA